MTRPLLVALVWSALIGAPLRAQAVAVEFLIDGELWKTDSGSVLLSRNGGELAALGRLRSWFAVRASPKLEFLAHAMVEGGSAEEEGSSSTWNSCRSRLVLGRRSRSRPARFCSPSEHSARAASNTNPLIGEPDAYPPQYPWGAVVRGLVSRFDYHIALASLPAVNTNYTPVPDPYLRPTAGMGVSFGPAFRIGGTVTHGPYLGDTVSAQLPSGSRWQDYKQTVVAADLRLSKGYVEARAEVNWSAYDVPTVADQLHGLGWYASCAAPSVRGSLWPAGTSTTAMCSCCR